MFDTGKTTVMDILGCEEGVDKIMCLPNFSTQPYDFLMRFLLLSFEEFDPFVVALFQSVNSPFSSADASTVLSSEPKEFVLYVEELAMTVMCYELTQEAPISSP